MARAQFSAETSGGGAFVRQPNRFTGRVTADSTSPPGGGPDEQDRWPLEAGRYRLIWCRACPWAHRARIVRGLLGLDDAISLGTVDPIRDERGWAFALDPDGFDPVLGVSFLSEAYLATDQDYTGRVTVPALVDTLTGRVVTNDYPQLTLDFSTEWRSLHRAGAPDLYPVELRPEMDALMAEIHTDVNNGVYRCGFATSQQAYDEAFRALFARLDALSERLAGQRYLMGGAITEADVRLFTTLVRFDAAYHGHFKCNRNKLTEMPVLWAYARDLFQTPGFGETVDFDHIKRHYYGTHREINPSGIVPLGPDESGWSTPHGRG
ncbi:glutathione S-transferase C-terminal domain-containing protein [Micromonospora noduli]|uniref:Glutathione S-transferase omega-like n=1 Tax=Micromonospora noduli TaxID=709876 RepID=A0A328N2C9_9ACTN|nr:glutathione S-transferase C-terminal domain-containing protein [Micromonospora noduli]KAB1923584.1 glutathione S-transferase family protein [Micromonospora noduli]RAN96886.1 Glutathione S-transferase omega-like [Micromonospora noduli]RAO05384.1 Glutathione S-transferase omega-like [Micromonospora noduli]RAO18216.1 Glutathione S-transferase omega-like [Micromonospora noduli]RAO18298.1 Glutathione S-transferase omega-like [Micromonospora noduli]